MQRNKRLAFCGILTAAALTIFVIETQIPLPIPVPGVKLGLANIITLFALIYLTPKEALSILVSRILLGAVFAGSPSALIYSIFGGLACFFAELCLIKLFKTRQIWALSAVGAMIHNLVQLTAAAFITKTASVFFYLPTLLIAAVLTGVFNGLCICYLDFTFGKRIRKLLAK